MPNVRSGATSTDYPSLEPALAADEYLRFVPDARDHRKALIEIARIAWSGEFPPAFFHDMGYLLRKLPWLVDVWVGPAVVEAISQRPDYEIEEHISWDSKVSVARVRTGFAQMEGLLLLAKIRAPDQHDVHATLARLLDGVAGGLLSDKRGTAKNAWRRHPLKDILYELGRPQTIEILADSLSRLIARTSTLYPGVGEFLESTCLRLVCGHPVSWAFPSELQEFLGVDQDPQANGLEPVAPKPIDLPQPSLRPFSADDLADEMIATIPSLEKHRAALQAIAPFWREENSWKFCEAIHRLSHRLRWIRAGLSQCVDLKALQCIGQEIHSTKFHFAIRKTVAWRERNRIAPMVYPAPCELYQAPSQKGPSGVLHLRGLLLMGRITWGKDQHPEFDAKLCQLIRRLDTLVERVDEQSGQMRPCYQHGALRAILDRIGQQDSVDGLIAALDAVLPAVLAEDSDAAALIQDAYLPMLKGEAIIPQQEPKPPRKYQPRSRPREARVRVPTRETPLEGEPLEEAEPGQRLVRNTKPSQGNSLKDELLWLQQRVWSRNELICRSHIESLSDVEVELFVSFASSQIESDLACGRVAQAQIGIQTVLTLITGQGPRTLASADSRLRRKGARKRRPELFLGEGVFRVPVMRPDNSFQLCALVKDRLERTEHHLLLVLPPTVQRWIAQANELTNQAWKWTPDGLREALNDYVRRINTGLGLGVSLGRIRNFARARIRAVTEDTAMTMVICGDSFGHASSPLYYFNCALSSLSTAFKQSMWPLFGDSALITRSMEPNRGRAGSELLVTWATARELARGPSAPLHKPGKRGREAKQLATDHNTLTNHVICILLAVAGHRPTAALLELKRFDFDLDQPAAIFQDKKCDPAHFYRYAPLADLIAEQINNYLSHLRGLASSVSEVKDLVERASAALRGTDALFFHLSEIGVPVELNLEEWRQRLPRAWTELPLNWGRTWLASRGREAGIEADHLAAALGHLESVGYPFSSESPMEPAALSRNMSNSLGRLAREAGWVLRRGVKSRSTTDELLAEMGTLADWKEERAALAEEARRFQLEQRHFARSQLRSKRQEAEKIAHSTLQDFVGSNLPSFESVANSKSRFDKQSAQETSCFAAVELSPDALEAVIERLADACEKDKVLSIAAHNALHRYLKSGNKRFGWKCAVPSPWLSTAAMEPTPFFSGMFRATAQLNWLRRNFGDIEVAPPKGSAFTEFEWACGIAAIALCIFGFQSNAEQLRAILRCRGSATLSLAIRDLLLISNVDRAATVGVRGLAAVAIARLQQRFPTLDLPSADRLDEVLAAQMPQPLAGTPRKLLERLCSTVDVANLVELSGLARIAMSDTEGCVSMGAARQRQFLEEGHGAIDEPSNEQDEIAPIDSFHHHRCNLNAAKGQYNQLRRLLHIGDGPKSFKLTSASLSQASIRMFRAPLVAELQAFIAQDTLSPLVGAIARFALHLTKHGTPQRREPAWATVYGYITTFGEELVAQCGEADFLNLESDDYLDIYQSVIDRKSSGYSKLIAARELAAFHRYLEAHHDFECVDFSDIEGVPYGLRPDIDAELVQPQEFERALRNMRDSARTGTPTDSNDATLARIERQALVFALLLRASGGRTNELAALRYKDVVIGPDGLVLIIRPSNYRRLKTSAARRIVDCSDRLTPRQRKLIVQWLAAEKARLGKTWKPTLPIFCKLETSSERTPTEHLRDATLISLEPAVGYRTRLHRVRHLVAAEELSSILMSDSDWRALRRARAGARRLVRRVSRHPVVLPRHLREKTLRIGHRRSSTTVGNYFHMPWIALSRPHEALHCYANRHAAAVALGVSVAGADKVLQRGKSQSRSAGANKPCSIWLMHAAGSPTEALGASPSRARTTLKSSHALNARLLDKMLRDIQRGLTLEQASLTYGFDEKQLSRLSNAIHEVEARTAFKLTRSADRKAAPRTTRRLKAALAVEKLLDLVDVGSEEVKNLVRSLASDYMIWANRSKSDELIWPSRKIEALVEILQDSGVAPSQVQRLAVPGKAGFERLMVLREAESQAYLNSAIAWILVVIYLYLAVQPAAGATQEWSGQC